MSDRTGFYLLGAAAVLGAVAVVDAARSNEWDLLTVTAGVTLLVVLAAVRQLGSRRPVGLRHDLVHWLEERAAATGETPPVLADRAVASYRARLEQGLAPEIDGDSDRPADRSER